MALTKKLGPLPRWGWLVILAIVLLYLHRRQQAAANAAASASMSPAPGSYDTQQAVSPYDQSGGGTSPYGGTFPVSGGGSGFDPSSFAEGIFYGKQFGGALDNPGTTGNGNGNAAPTPSGPTNINIYTRTPTRKRKGGITHSGPPAGGSPPPNRHPDQHKKRKGAKGTFKTTGGVGY